MLKKKKYRQALDRKKAANAEVRLLKQAAELVADETCRTILRIPPNEEEQEYATNPVSSYANALWHGPFGEVDYCDRESLVKELCAPLQPGTPNEFYVPLGLPQGQIFHHRVIDPKTGTTNPAATRRWETPMGEFNSDLIGPAPAGVAMPPAPPLGSSELSAEMAELYAMALLRDLSFRDMEDPTKSVEIDATTFVTVQQILDELNALPWFNQAKTSVSFDPGANSPRALNCEEINRRNARFAPGDTGLTIQTLFRGSTSGARTGPYLSQFLLVGNGDTATEQNAGEISYGTQKITQKNQPDPAGIDYMTGWFEWLDVQDGARHLGAQNDETSRFLSTLRDMTAYVHCDQLYQAYLNACLLLLEQGVQLDTGLPNAERMAREGYATWGGPHLLSLLTEVASRALKAMRRQKFQIHRRARPEVIAARITLEANGHGDKLGAARPRVSSMLDELLRDAPNLMEWVRLRNIHNQARPAASRGLAYGTLPQDPAIETPYFLPMAFPEGSPMQPAQGAGHATVAGACVTILKAFLRTTNDKGDQVPLSALGFSGDQVGNHSHLSRSNLEPAQTLEGELDKLGANISIARNMAGVHFYSDYYESLRMGERIAVGILEEQLIGSPESMSMSFHDFDGNLICLGVDVSTGVNPNEIDTQRYLEMNHRQVSEADWSLEHLPA